MHYKAHKYFRDNNRPMLFLHRAVLGSDMAIGCLEVRVLRAKQLIPSDIGGTSDPYVKLQMASSADPYSGGRPNRWDAHSSQRYGHQHETEHQVRTLAPEWNTPDDVFLLRVKHPNDVLLVEVFDRDTFTSDDFLGRVRVPVGALRNGEAAAEWLQLTDHKDRPRAGAIHLELIFSYSQIGRFFSHFDRAPPPEPGQPEPWETVGFDIDELYVNAQRVMAYLTPPLNAFWELQDLFSWRVPPLSAFWLGTWIFLCLYPRLLLCAVHLKVLRYIYGQYVIHEVRALPALQTHHGASTAAAAESSIFKGGDDEDHLGGAVKSVANLLPSSYTETLQWLQWLFGYIADSFDTIDDLFKWKDRTNSIALVAVVVISSVLFLVFPFNYYLLAQGACCFLTQVRMVVDK